MFGSLHTKLVEQNYLHNLYIYIGLVYTYIYLIRIFFYLIILYEDDAIVLLTSNLDEGEGDELTLT